MAELKPENGNSQAMEEVPQSEEPVAMGEDDSMTSSEPTMKKINQQRCNHQKTKL